ncbi:DUF2911 domain-containing protein [Spirosoma sp. SC4-14]|uniref:DUF2911 domain-containing protein n=1 Tax=Spirosoma sp. SC4-14 TaxID=3128900 RepID=UPI0030CC617D
MRRVLLLLGIIAVILLAGFFALRIWTKSSSPESMALYSQDGFSIKVDYCRPYKKGRTIFGGLVPYGNVWRTGANEATVIELGQNVDIAGKALSAGTYSLWTIPTRENWTIIFNRETGQWGTDYNPAEDVLRVPVPAQPHNPVADQFTIMFSPETDGADMLLIWDQTEVVVPIRKQ